MRKRRAITLTVRQEYLSPSDVARMTGFSVRALETMRHRKKGPRFFRCGRLIRYHVADVRAWIEQCSSE